MLRVRVLRDVFPQTLLVRETLVARVAAVRSVSHVGARVGLQVGQLGEGFATPRVLTLVRFLPRVGTDVLL